MDYSNKSQSELIEIINSLNRKATLADAISFLSTELHLVLDKSEIIKYVSPSFLHITDFTEDEIIGKHPRDFLHKNDYSKVMTTIEQSFLSPGKVIKLNPFQALINNEKYTHYEGSLSSMLEDPNVEGVLCNLKVIEQQETARKTALEYERRLKLIFDTIPHGIFECNIDGQILLCNDSYRQIVNLTEDEIANSPLFSLIADPTERETLPEYFKHVVKERVIPTPYFTTLLSNSGKKTHIKVDWNYVVNEDLEPTGFSGVITDTTAIVESEKELRDSLEHLKHRNNELKHFGFLVTHDLRSPLVNIEGFTGELKLDCKNLLEILNSADLSKEGKEKIMPILEDNIPVALKFISSGVKEMYTLIKGVHKLTEITYATRKPESIDVNKTVESLKTNFHLDHNHGDDISISSSNLPNCHADGAMLKSIFTYLIDNAIAFKSPARKCKINVTAKLKNETVTYCIEDNGMGIDDEFHKKVFIAFHQLDPENSAGDGLGLSLVVRLLERNNGSIWLESQFGEWTKFYFSLPIKEN